MSQILGVEMCTGGCLEGSHSSTIRLVRIRKIVYFFHIITLIFEYPRTVLLVFLTHFTRIRLEVVTPFSII